MEDDVKKFGVFGCLGFLLASTAYAADPHAREEMQICTNILQVGITAQLLEDKSTCHFRGHASARILADYTDGGCRSILPQTVVDKLSARIAGDMQRASDSSGLPKFCEDSK